MGVSCSRGGAAGAGREEGLGLAPREAVLSQRCLAGVNAVFLFSGLGVLVVSYMTPDTIVAHFAAAMGLCCVGLGLFGLISQCANARSDQSESSARENGRLRPYGVLVGVLSLLGLWISLVAWFRGDMAMRVFESLAASDWEAYFDSLEPSFRRQVLAQHAGCDSQYSGSCWGAVQEHTTHRYFRAVRICVPAALSLAVCAAVSLRRLLGSETLVSDLDWAWNYTALVFGVAMVGTSAVEYAAMATWVGRSACWSMICAGFTLMMISICSVVIRAGSFSSARHTSVITTASSSVLDICLFLLAQGLFVVALGCFVAKHTLVKSLRGYLDEHALQDVLAEYQHIAGCEDSAEIKLEARANHGFSCEASELAWMDAERVFRRQLDTIGWSLMLATLLLIAKLICGRHVRQRMTSLSADDTTGVLQEDVHQNLTMDGARKHQYGAVSQEDDEEKGISRSSPIPPSRRTAGSEPWRFSRQAGSMAVEGPIEEHSFMLEEHSFMLDADLGEAYRGPKDPSDVLSLASVDTADITELDGPHHFPGFDAGPLPKMRAEVRATGVEDDHDQLSSRGSSGGSLLGVSSPAVGRRGSLQLPLAEQSAWYVDLQRCVRLPCISVRTFDPTSVVRSSGAASRRAAWAPRHVI